MPLKSRRNKGGVGGTTENPSVSLSLHAYETGSAHKTLGAAPSSKTGALDETTPLLLELCLEAGGQIGNSVFFLNI